MGNDMKTNILMYSNSLKWHIICHGFSTCYTKHNNTSHIKDPPWVSYKEEHCHQRDGFMLVWWGLLRENLHKSIPRETIFFLINMPWWILCLPWHKTKYTIELTFTNTSHGRSKNNSCVSLKLTYTHFGTLTSKRFATCSCFHLYYMTVITAI